MTDSNTADAGPGDASTGSSFGDALDAHSVAVGLVRDEAELMCSSGDLATASSARRVHILADALAFIMSSAPQSAVVPYTDTGFSEQLKAADAATDSKSK